MIQKTGSFPVISQSKSLYSCPVSTSGVVPAFPFTFTGFPENRKLLLPFSLLIRRNQRVFSIVFLYRIPYTQHRIIKL